MRAAGKTPNELGRLCFSANDRTKKAYSDQTDDYWYWRCRSAEIEWVCNVVSAILFRLGYKPLLPDQPTVRAMEKLANVIVKSDGVLATYDNKKARRIPQK